MHDTETSRRSLLKSAGAVAGLGIVGSLSGCSSVPIGDSDGGADSDADKHIERVPDGSTFVTHVKVGEILSDETFVQRVNELLGEQVAGQGGPQSIDEALNRVEVETGVDPSDVSEMLVFGNMETSTAGTILWTDWEQDTVTSALTDNGFEEDAYSGTTVYAETTQSSDTTAIALLDDSTYGVGTQESLQTLIDTWNGDAPAVSGDVETAFTSAQGGYVQFGFDVPSEQVPDSGGETSEMNLQVLNNIEYGYGSVTDADNGREMVVKMEASNEDAAEGLNGLVEFARSAARRQLQQASQRPDANTQEIEEFITALTNVETERDGTTVTVRNDDGITFAIGALAVAGTFVLGFGSSTSRGRSVSQRETSPEVLFEVDYDGSSLVITHTAGDMVRADRLYVQGAGGDGQSWASLGGSTASTVDGQPAVAAGDSLELTSVGSDYQLQLVWRSSSTSTTLLSDRGPDA